MFKDLTKVTQGCVGLGHAIAHFVSTGNTVSLPLIDNQDYDLIVDESSVLKKVQVKTSKTKAKSGFYEVQLKAVRSNRTENVIKNFDGNTVDYLFILLADSSKYLIPSNEVDNVSTMTMNKSRDKFKI